MAKFLQSLVVKRLLWTILFVFIYVLGCQLILPFVAINDASFASRATDTLSFSVALMGGNLRSISLFSVGLSPWMSSMIIWQMFSFSKKLGLKKLPVEIQDRRRMYLTLAIAVVQSLAVTLSLPMDAGVPRAMAVLMNTLLLIAGTFFLVWLSDLNSLMGIGGSIVILMASMMISLPGQIITSIRTLGISWSFILILIVLGLIFLYISVVVQRARYRIPINKITIHNRFNQYSYLDIMLNPAGGMPFMYAMSLVSIPQYLLMLLQVIWPQADWVRGWMIALTIGHPVWLAVYLSILFILGIAFAFVNVSGEQISEHMRKSGEYIYGVYPGRETSRYINSVVLRFALIGTTYTLIMAGGPMLVVLINPLYLQLSMIPGMFLIFSGMMFNVREEIEALTLNESYTGLFD